MFRFILQYKVILFVHFNILNTSLPIDRSLILMRNNNGRNAEPCGTPIDVEFSIESRYIISKLTSL